MKAFLTSMIVTAAAIASMPASAAVRADARTYPINAGNVVTDDLVQSSGSVTADATSVSTYTYGYGCVGASWITCYGDGYAIAQASGDLSTGKMRARSSITGPIDNAIANTVVAMSDVVTFSNIDPAASYWVPFEFGVEGLFTTGSPGQARSGLSIGTPSLGGIFGFTNIFGPGAYSEDIIYINNAWANFTSDGAGHISGAFLVDQLHSTFNINMSLTTIINADFSHTGTFAFPNLPAGVSFTSESGAFLTRAAAGVPEPATWSLMILGFGLIGGAMRKSRQRLRITYA